MYISERFPVVVPRICECVVGWHLGILFVLEQGMQADLVVRKV
jgi:hypothetical protein